MFQVNSEDIGNGIISTGLSRPWIRLTFVLETTYLRACTE